MSPNPGGKAKVIREAIEAFRRPKDLERLRQRLLELADDADGRVAVAAIKEYHDRSYGKAPQAITGPDGEAIRVDLVSLVTSLKTLAGDDGGSGTT